MDDAVAAVLASYLGFFAIPVAFMQLLGQKLKEFVSVLLFGCDKILEGFLLAYPEAREDVGRRIAVGVLSGVEILEHVVHGAA